MSDLTTDAGAIVSEHTRIQSRRRAQRTEFTVYFAVIFLATLPLATLTWALHAFKGRKLPAKGPMARAWTQARIITPMIFSA